MLLLSNPGQLPYAVGNDIEEAIFEITDTAVKLFTRYLYNQKKTNHASMSTSGSVTIEFSYLVSLFSLTLTFAVNYIAIITNKKGEKCTALIYVNKYTIRKIN